MAKESNKDKALSALLATDTIAAAAKKCGLSVDSLYRYLKEPEFLREYRAARRSVMEATLSQVQRASGKAADTLKKNLSCGNAAVENAAARILLETAFRGIEITDIQERLEILENAQQNDS